VELGGFEPPTSWVRFTERLGAPWWQTAFDVFGPQLKPGSERRWSFGGLGGTFEARIEDPEFAEKVANHEEEFGVGDQLDATVEVVQTRDPDAGTIKDTRRVVKVKRVIKGPKQLPLGPLGHDAADDPPRTRP
jgi:hypothetical protein